MQIEWNRGKGMHTERRDHLSILTFCGYRAATLGKQNKTSPGLVCESNSVITCASTTSTGTKSPADSKARMQ